MHRLTKPLVIILIGLFNNFAYAQCSLIPNSQACVDATPCKQDTNGNTICLSGVQAPAGALSIPETCWQYSYQFACANQTAGATNTCSQYSSNPNCTVINTTCGDTIAETNQCDSWIYTYQCQTSPAQTSPSLNCTNGLFSSIVPTPNNANNNLPTAALAQEILREAQVYNQNGSNLFAGVSENCTKGYFGLKNCCSAAPGAQSNSQVSEQVMSTGFSVVKYAGEQAVDWASPYVFDFMYTNGIWTQGLTDEFATSGFCSVAGDTPLSFGTNLAGNGLSLSAWGFTFSATPIASGTGLLGGNIALGSGTNYLAFNPYVFAAELMITYAMSLLACTTEEQQLAMHKGANLSAYIDEYCSKKVLGSCLEYTDDYCSFNSLLAKIINIQGKQQLGLPLAGCGGITPQQLSQIDFAKIDFSQFTQQMVNNATKNMPSNTTINGAYSPLMQSTTNGSAQSKTSTVLPAY